MMECNETNLFTLIFNLNRRILLLISQIASNGSNVKQLRWELAKSKRHLRYAQLAWAWCLRKNTSRRSELKTWFNTLSSAYPQELYFKIKSSEISAEDGNFTLAKNELLSYKSAYPNLTDIIDVPVLSLNINQAIVNFHKIGSEFSNNLQFASEFYQLSDQELQLLRSTAINPDPLAGYARALLTYMTGERLEPAVNYTVVPRTTYNESNSKDTKEIISLFPNPAQNFIQIDTKNMYEKSSYTYNIYDLMGNKLIRGSLSESKSINIELLSNGIYLIKIFKDSDLLEVQKFVIYK